MEVYKDIIPLQRYVYEHKFHGKKIGLVPTMGALHEGHLSLIAASQADNDLTICTIFVNPTQFNNKQDLERYPRTLEKDLLMLQKAGCDVVFCPSDHDMYQSEPKLAFQFKYLDQVLEGRFRPGHFSGVALIVSKLFNIVVPDRAYFGQKDLQQFLVISQLVKDLLFNIELKCVPILRESDGLAMSSRNRRLSAEGRSKAVILYRALTEAQKMLRIPIALNEVKEQVKQIVEQAGVQLEYFEVVDPETLELATNISEKKNVALCVAGYVEGVRLIDNVIFDLEL